MKQSVQVEIAGHKLAIRSDQGPGYVQELAKYVDVQLRAVSGNRGGSFNVGRAALLVAIQLADELLREKDLARQFRDQVGVQLGKLRDALELHERQLEALTPSQTSPAG